MCISKNCWFPLFQSVICEACFLAISLHVCKISSRVIIYLGFRWERFCCFSFWVNLTNAVHYQARSCSATGMITNIICQIFWNQLEARSQMIHVFDEKDQFYKISINLFQETSRDSANLSRKRQINEHWIMIISVFLSFSFFFYILSDHPIMTILVKILSIHIYIDTISVIFWWTRFNI